MMERLVGRDHRRCQLEAAVVAVVLHQREGVIFLCRGEQPKSLSGPLQDPPTLMATVEFTSKWDSPNLLLLYCPEGPDLLMPSLK